MVLHVNADSLRVVFSRVGFLATCGDHRRHDDVLWKPAGSAETARLAEHPGQERAGGAATHEHSDHIRGIDAFSRRHASVCPVYATRGTLAALTSKARVDCASTVRRCEPLRIGTLSILPFRTSHDAAEPVEDGFESARQSGSRPTRAYSPAPSACGCRHPVPLPEYTCACSSTDRIRVSSSAGSARHRATCPTTTPPKRSRDWRPTVFESSRCTAPARTTPSFLAAEPGCKRQTDRPQRTHRGRASGRSVRDSHPPQGELLSAE